MQPRPEIAVVTSNTLMGLGLKAILEKVIPVAEIEIFGEFGEFTAAGPERFYHFFVASQLFVAHSGYFRPLSHKTIVLTAGRRQEFGGMHCLNVSGGEEALVRDILRMHHGAHPGEHTAPAPHAPHKELLTAREAEVLGLLVRGCINKQIADRLHIGLTTVITHRRNIMEKLGAKSVSALAIYALSMGYVDPDDL